MYLHVVRPSRSVRQSLATNFSVSVSSGPVSPHEADTK